MPNVKNLNEIHAHHNVIKHLTYLMFNKWKLDQRQAPVTPQSLPPPPPGTPSFHWHNYIWYTKPTFRKQGTKLTQHHDGW
jgi:hypothetical protein